MLLLLPRGFLRTTGRVAASVALIALGVAGASVANAKTPRREPPPAAEEPAPAAEANGSPAWTKQCATSPNGKSQVCFVQQFVVAKPKNIVMLKVLFSYSGPGGKPRMIVEAPEGVLLQAGLVLTIDDRKPLDVPFETCQRGACRAIIDMDDAALDQFRKGTTLTVRYVTGDHKALDLPVKLESLSAALKQIAP